MESSIEKRMLYYETECRYSNHRKRSRRTFQRVEFTKRTGYYINYQVRSGKQ